MAASIAAIVGLIVVLSDRGDDAATDDPDSITTVTSTGVSTTVGATEAPTTTEAATTVAPTTTTADVAAGTPNDPLPIEGARFTYEESFGDTTWEGTLYGIVDVDTNQFNDEEGRCILVIGTIIPTNIDGGTITNGFDTPEFGAIDDDGIAIDSSVADCDTEAAEAAGYDWINEATVTAGTPFAFYDEVFFPGEPEAGIQAIQAGGEPQNSTYYQPTEIGQFPRPQLDDSNSRRPPRGDPIEGAAFTYEEDFNNAVWDGRLFGLIETPASDFIEAPGRCFVVLGVLTPTATEEGNVSDGFDTPDIGAVSRGRYRRSEVNSCDTDAAEAAGFQWILNADVELGTPYPFFAELWVPGGQQIQSVVLGPGTGEGALFYRPGILAEVPTP